MANKKEDPAPIGVERGAVNRGSLEQCSGDRPRKDYALEACKRKVQIAPPVSLEDVHQMVVESETPWWMAKALERYARDFGRDRRRRAVRDRMHNPPKHLGGPDIRLSGDRAVQRLYELAGLAQAAVDRERKGGVR